MERKPNNDKKYFFAIRKSNIDKDRLYLTNNDIYFICDTYDNLTEEQKENNLLPYEYYINAPY